MRLLSKISVIVAVTSALTMAAAGSFVFTFTRSALQNDSRMSQEELGSQTIDKIDRYLFRYYVGIQNISEEENTQRTISGQEIDARYLSRRVGELMFLTGPWDTLRFFNSNGDIVVSNSQQIVGDYKIDTDSDTKVALENALEGKVYYSDFLISKVTGKPTMIFAAPVRNEDNPDRPVVGAVIGEIAWPVIGELLQAVDPATELNLYNRSGVFIATNQSAPVGLYAPNTTVEETIKKIPTTAIRSSSVVPDLEGEIRHGTELVTSVRSLGNLSYKGNGWILFVVTPTASAFAPAGTTARNISLILFPIVLITAALVLIFLQRIVVSPISTFMEATRKISSGNFDERIRISSRDEIGQLATAFNDMTQKLHVLYSSMEEQVRKKTAELSNQVTEVEKSKSAILNLLEDIEEEKKGVEDVVKLRTKELGDEKGASRRFDQ